VWTMVSSHSRDANRGRAIMAHQLRIWASLSPHTESHISVFGLRRSPLATGLPASGRPL